MQAYFFQQWADFIAANIEFVAKVIIPVMTRL